jgi:hypothetical protein
MFYLFSFSRFRFRLNGQILYRDCRLVASRLKIDRLSKLPMTFLSFNIHVSRQQEVLSVKSHLYTRFLIFVRIDPKYLARRLTDDVSILFVEKQ